MGKKSLVPALLVIAAFSAPTAAQKPASPDRAVFGMMLGEPFRVPECPVDRFGFYDKYKAKSACYTLGLGEKKNETLSERSKITIEYPFEEKPEIVTGWTVNGFVLDGRLEAVTFATHGLPTVTRDLKILTDKYGEPHELQRRTVQKFSGGTFEAFRASWVFQDLIVSFDSAFGRLDRGLVTIETPRGQKLLIEQPEKGTQAKTPL